MSINRRRWTTCLKLLVMKTSRIFDTRLMRDTNHDDFDVGCRIPMEYGMCMEANSLGALRQ